MADLIALADARALVVDSVVPLATETVALADALGRVLAEDVVATADAPPWPSSAMDGYAVRSGPAGRSLRVIDEARAGFPAAASVEPETAIRISTGAPVPAGADAVIRVEDTEESDHTVVLNADVAPDRNIRMPGEDMRSGTVVVTAGTRLGPGEIAGCAVAGAGDLVCAVQPGVAVTTTGSELVDPGVDPAPGQIADSNGPMLAALARCAGARVVSVERRGDERADIEAALGTALETADVVAISGGMSVGAHDHVKDALDSLGVDRRFWGVAMRPGKPALFGTRDRTLVFGLPGNPVSAAVGFLLYARPAIRALQGAPAIVTATATLTEPVARLPRLVNAIRVRLEETASGMTATPNGSQGSHVVTSLIGADALAFIPAGEGELAAGESVTVERI
jgi:molybdopterin molybdotransferase